MKVWRCENADGKGPYWEVPSCLRPDWMQAHNMSDDHPSPHQDNLSHRMLEKHFGFSSFEQLDKWFPKLHRDDMRDRGFDFYVYEVDEPFVELGGKQCCFDKKHAVKIEEELR